jgi:pimeloyl-ACP methyl ester carboxylesterase
MEDAMLKRVTAILFVVILLTLPLAACGRPAPAQSVPDGAQAGDLFLEPCTYEAGKVKYEADCGTLVVPENRSKPGSRLIALPVVRIRATGGSPAEPILWLEGGPGQSNIGFDYPPSLLVNHDFVMVGYRGADGSVVLDCPEVNRAIKGVGDDALSDASLDHVAGAMRQCVERLQGEGVDLDGYTIPEVVADMEAARVALGYERVNLLSESYGTRVAQIYAYLHSESIHRSAMIGVNPPGHFVWEPETIDAQLATYADLCAQDTACSGRTEDLAETMRRVAHAMPRRWLLLPIDPGKVRIVTFMMLFHRNTAAMVFDAYLAAEAGDPSGLALMSLAYDFIMPSAFTWGDLLTKGGSADYDPARDYRAELDTPDSIIGSPTGLLIWEAASQGCPVTLIPAELRQVHTSEVETLLVSGSVDFSTPPQFATDELLPYLPNGRQVILAEMGHTDDLRNAQPEATERLLNSFFDTGVADDSLYTYEPMNFHVGMGFPALAKIALGVVAALILVVVVAVWLVARRIVRQRATRKPAQRIS